MCNMKYFSMRINLFSFFFYFFFFLLYFSLFSPYYLPFSQINNNNFPFLLSHDHQASYNVCIHARKSFTIYLINFHEVAMFFVEMPTNQRSLPTSFFQPPPPTTLLHPSTLSKCIIKLLARSFCEWTVYKTRKRISVVEMI